MNTLTPGANTALTETNVFLTISLPAGAVIDISALQLAENGKVRGDADMCFFNQPTASNGALALVRSEQGAAEFTMNLDGIDAEITKIVFTATIDGAGTTFGDLGPVSMKLGSDIEAAIPHEGRSETALILGEVYRHNGGWKFRNVGQGFNGGLAALATSFGVDVGGDPAPDAVDPKVSAINLAKEKRLIDLEKKDPQLVSLVKKIGVNLEKKGFTPPRSKVCLVMDISGSMTSNFRSGKVDTLVQRALALGLTFDDDGDIDVFLFGKKVHDYGSLNADTYKGFSARLMDDKRLEADTRYGAAMERVRDFYRADNPENLPVYVLFVTDGSTTDKPKTKKMLINSCAEPIFWKFVGLIQPGVFANNRQGFLQELDDLPGRTIDNADFFNVTDPADPDDEKFLNNMMEEFPEWMAAAKAAGVL
ncbi:MAG: VWA domain-containing protein [Roseibium sp.]|uniref:VWA domain-containing protein n=1 Tax=Roseibium sp. TaxID=1936156 RepID=UPI003299E3A0